jgi:hypothetical protein
MNSRRQITLDPKMQRQAQAKAAELGISFAEYVRRLVAQDIGVQTTKADISSLFDLIDEGEPTDIVRNKHKMIGEALWDEYRRETGREPRRQARAGTGRG